MFQRIGGFFYENALYKFTFDIEIDIEIPWRENAPSGLTVLQINVSVVSKPSAA